MSKIRSLKPEAFTSETLNSVEAAVRWTFAGIWTECDDEGRMVYNDSRVLTSRIYAIDVTMTPAIVAEHVAQLAAIGAIHRYTVAGKSYLHVPSWREHQHPNRVFKSRIPPCPDTTHQVPEQCSDTAQALREHCVDTDGSGSGPVLSGQVEVEVVVDRTPDRQPPKNSTKGKTRVPAEFEVTMPLRKWARDLNINCDLKVETEAWRDSHLAKGTLANDWVASWRTWMRNTLKYGAVKAARTDGPSYGGGW